MPRQRLKVINPREVTLKSGCNKRLKHNNTRRPTPTHSNMNIRCSQCSVAFTRAALSFFHTNVSLGRLFFQCTLMFSECAPRNIYVCLWILFFVCHVGAESSNKVRRSTDSTKKHVRDFCADVAQTLHKLTSQLVNCLRERTGRSFLHYECAHIVLHVCVLPAVFNVQASILSSVSFES